MTTAGAPPTAASCDDDTVAQEVVAVHSCSRIGLRANPPGFAPLGWFRFRLRRRGKSAG